MLDLKKILKQSLSTTKENEGKKGTIDFKCFSSNETEIRGFFYGHFFFFFYDFIDLNYNMNN
jgi:hypothetical protein